MKNAERISRFTPDQIERINHSCLNPLAIYIFALLFTYPSKTYETISQMVEAESGVPIHRNEIGGFVSGLIGRRESRCTNNFRVLNESFVAYHTLKQLEQGHKPVNKKAVFLKQVFDELERKDPIILDSRKRVIYQSPHGKIKEAAHRLSLHPVFITIIGKYIRLEMEALAQKDPNNEYAQQYLDTVRKIARAKSEKRLGKTSSDQGRLLDFTDELRSVKSYANLNNLGKIPNEWLAEIMISSIPFLRSLFADPYFFSETDREILLKLKQRGHKIKDIGDEMGIGNNVVKLLKNLLIYGKPSDITQDPFPKNDKS